MIKENNGQTFSDKRGVMNKKRIIILILATCLCSACMARKWEIKQVETTFINEESRREFVQKNTILLNTGTGKTWVFESDGESNYYWQNLPDKDKNEP